MNGLIDTIRDAWGWTGLSPSMALAVNSFGNVIIQARDGKIWRICPEELSCVQIAPDSEALKALLDQADFKTDWRMDGLAQVAMERFGEPGAERCFCLKIPAPLGGQYEADNLMTTGVIELLAFAGDLAEQVKGLPDGAQVKLVITD